MLYQATPPMTRAAPTPIATFCHVFIAPTLDLTITGPTLCPSMIVRLDGAECFSAQSEGVILTSPASARSNPQTHPKPSKRRSGTDILVRFPLAGKGNSSRHACPEPRARATPWAIYDSKRVRQPYG